MTKYYLDSRDKFGISALVQFVLIFLAFYFDSVKAQCSGGQVSTFTFSNPTFETETPNCITFTKGSCSGQCGSPPGWAKLVNAIFGINGPTYWMGSPIGWLTGGSTVVVTRDDDCWGGGGNPEISSGIFGWHYFAKQYPFMTVLHGVNSYVGQNVALAPQTSYSVTLWARYRPGQGQSSITMYFGSRVVGSFSNLGSSWQKFTISFTTSWLNDVATDTFKFVNVGGSCGTSSSSACDADLTAITFSSQGCAACPIGTYSSGGSSITCMSCIAGEYNSAAGSYSCNVCFAGSYCPGASDQIKCPANTYNPHPGATSISSCLPCPIKGVSAAGSTTCSCTSGILVAGTGDYIYCNYCVAGQYFNNGNCPNCPVGYVTASNYLTACTACPAGKSTSGTGMSVCDVSCTPGFYCPSGGGSPAACAQGAYSTDPANMPCTKCPTASTTTGTHSTTCVCLAGYASSGVGKTLSCTPCDPGTFQSAPGGTTCDPCAAGSYSDKPGSTSCTFCASGRYSNAGATTCFNCPPGYSCPGNGATKQSCPQNTYSLGFPSATCLPCPPNSFSGPLSSTCSCNSGYVPSGTGSSLSCSICFAGSYCQGGSPIPCGANTYSVAGSSACIPCPGSYVSPAGASACYCPFGFEPNGQVGGCSACPVGKYITSDSLHSCVACPPDSYSSKPSSPSCTPCLANSHPSSDSSTCLCIAGYYSISAVTTQCTPCAAGYYAPQVGSTSCLQCPPGSSSEGIGDVVCSKCPSYSTLDSGSNSCICVAGYTLDTTVKYAPLKPKCNACTPGKYKASASRSTCQDCPLNTYVADSGAAACFKCQAGASTSTTGSSTCNCQDGYSQSGVGDSLVCTQCLPGTFAKAGASSCTPCPANSYSSAYGSSECSLCPAYSTSVPGSSSCKCNDGTSTQIIGGTLVCTPCLAGFYAVSSDSTCTSCPINTYSNAMSSHCTPCPIYSSSTGQSSTCACRAGYSQTGTGDNLKCTACPIGSYSLGPSTLTASGSTECTLCAQGTYSNNVARSSQCNACPANSSPAWPQLSTAPNNNLGATSCVCNRGYSQISFPDGVASICSACIPGTFSATSGSSTCISCDVGKYSSSPASSSCTQCPQSSTSLAGASTCTCLTGYSQSGSGDSLSCSICPAGTFSKAGDSLCTPCLPNTYAPTAGSTECTPCPDHAESPLYATSCACIGGYGLLQLKTSNSACVPCKPGYAAAPDSNICLACPANTYSQSNGISVCEACPAFSVSLPGQTKCTCLAGYSQQESNDGCTVCPYTVSCNACPVNTFSSSGSRTCTPCPPHSHSSPASSACTCDDGYTPYPTTGNSNSLTCVLFPTSFPTGQPSMQPSSHPSRRPSRQPTSRPTLRPTRRPSSQPTSQPLSRPTHRPTAQPSRQPISRPTGHPSRQPTTRPTASPSAPTSQPSSHPSCHPSSQPSSNPSMYPTRMVSQIPYQMAYFKVYQEVDGLAGSWNSSSLSGFVFQEAVAAVLSKVGDASGMIYFHSVYVLSVEPVNANNDTTASTPPGGIMKFVRRMQQQQPPSLPTSNPSYPSSVMVLYIINYYSMASDSRIHAVADTLINALEEAVTSGAFTLYLNAFAANVQVTALETAVIKKAPVIVHTPVAFDFTHAPTGTQTMAPMRMNWNRLIMICAGVVAAFGCASLLFCGCIMYYHHAHKNSKADKYKVWDDYQKSGGVTHEDRLRIQKHWNAEAERQEKELAKPAESSVEMSPIATSPGYGMPIKPAVPSQIQQYHASQYTTTTSPKIVPQVQSDQKQTPDTTTGDAMHRPTLSEMDFGFYGKSEGVSVDGMNNNHTGQSGSNAGATSPGDDSTGIRFKNLVSNPLKAQNTVSMPTGQDTQQSAQNSSSASPPPLYNPMHTMNKGFK